MQLSPDSFNKITADSYKKNLLQRYKALVLTTSVAVVARSEPSGKSITTHQMEKYWFPVLCQ